MSLLQIHFHIYTSSFELGVLVMVWFGYMHDWLNQRLLKDLLLRRSGHAYYIYAVIQNGGTSMTNQNICFQVNMANIACFCTGPLPKHCLIWNPKKAET